jgi:hypothetical protein
LWAAFLFARKRQTLNLKFMFPILILLAGAAFTAPVALADSAAIVPPTVQNPETMREYVQEYFKDTPILAAIAECESHMRQFGKDGEVIKNPKSTAIGVMQIMSSLHIETAEELGLDITTTEGNLAYAQYLYDKQGTKPWNSSKSCWGKRVAAK